MRLCTPASLCLAAATAAVLPAAAPARAEAPLPACASAGDRAFPLTTRLRDGPASYTAGGGSGTWYLELTNTTGRSCTGIHPVVVLVDEERALEPSQPRLEFHDGKRSHLVRFESTDRDELVGAFADEDAGFPGFTVAPGGTLTVEVRLAVAPDAVPNEVTANAAVVQRHEDDGDWVGQSNDYRFRITAAAPASPAPPTPHRPRPDASDAPGTDVRTPAEPSGPTDPASLLSAAPGTAPPGRPLPVPGELAGTGFRSLHALLTAAAVLLTGAGAVLLARGRR
ncbi:hypothetical protein GCM10010266_09090 [Streptomyces griseomycini]|uniref:hypothetical protein n=1 Tax=Streptomyces griseomycini TaxID=66895 RepID=UPI0019CD3232|nr:hypothetical protein [Streptomyces griseomycini]GGP88164.1 hypothetical protein GCM10010266_09090 [Streptomyces griseomycini]